MESGVNWRVIKVVQLLYLGIEPDVFLHFIDMVRWRSGVVRVPGELWGIVEAFYGHCVGNV